ncbi:MAG: hypothetical protein ACOCW4_00830 [bacterium]
MKVLQIALCTYMYFLAFPVTGQELFTEVSEKLGFRITHLADETTVHGTQATWFDRDMVTLTSTSPTSTEARNCARTCWL